MDLRLVIIGLIILSFGGYFIYLRVNKKDEFVNSSFLICKRKVNFGTQDNLIGTQTEEHIFTFEGQNFIKYVLKKTIEYNMESYFTSYCLSCNKDAIKNLMKEEKGIKVDISTKDKKYIYENIEIDIKKYSSDDSNYIYSLKPFNTSMTKKDIISATNYLKCE